MGLFDDIPANNASAGVEVRKDDKDGTFLQRIDCFKEEKSNDGVAYLKAYKTTVAVLDAPKGMDRSNEVGEETTRAYFMLGKLGFYGVRDLKQLIQAATGKSDSEMKAMPAKELGTFCSGPLFDQTFGNRLFEIRARVRVKSGDKKGTYTEDTVRRMVPVEDLPSLTVLDTEGDRVPMTPDMIQAALPGLDLQFESAD
jgi:hypothetical protein